ncbi:MAG: reverse transcriptase family protein [Planctomycetota bacterium]
MTAPPHSWAWFQHCTGYDRDALLRLQAEAPNLYRPFDVRNGQQKWRHIDNPTGALKRAQSRIKRLLCNELKVHPALHGGVPSKSTRSAAEDHIHQPCLVGIDISSYFPSVTNKAVYRFFIRYLGCVPELAKCLTELTTHGGHLPQGAPTSTIIANLLNRQLFDVLLGIASAHKCAMTVYVDDIFFSGRRARDCIGPAISALRKFGYRTSRKKVRIMPQSGEQVMLGLSVGHGIALPAAKLATIRAAIGAVESSGVVSFRGLERLRRQVAWVKGFDPDTAVQLGQQLMAAERGAVVVFDPDEAAEPESGSCDLANCRATSRQRGQSMTTAR